MVFEYLLDKDTAKVNGFAEEIRILGAVAFVILRNKEGTLQVLFKKKDDPELFDSLKNITIESYLTVNGEVVLSKQARNGFEIKATSFELVAKSEALPIDVSGKIKSDLSTRFDHRFLDLRIRKNLNLFMLRSKFIKYTNEFYQKEGFMAVNMPKITTIGAESGAELFNIDYFGKNAYLSQSPQIYKQMLQAAGFERIYEIGPVFRAEKSNTSRHLTEFIGVDCEFSNVETLQEIMDMEESLFRYIMGEMKKNDFALLEEMEVKFNLPENFPVIEFKDALKLLEKEYNHKIDDDDLDPEGEKLLGKHFLEKEGSDFVFVTNYPISTRPFYHMYNSDNETTNSFDLIYKGVEITTGAVREHRLDLFLKQAKDKGLNPDDMKEYVDVLRYGIPKHGGFGIGLDRIIQKMSGVDNVKEASLFPRDPDRMGP